MYLLDLWRKQAWHPTSGLKPSAILSKSGDR